MSFRESGSVAKRLDTRVIINECTYPIFAIIIDIRIITGTLPDRIRHRSVDAFNIHYSTEIWQAAKPKLTCLKSDPLFVKNVPNPRSFTSVSLRPSQSFFF
jgi:hypothetical protein